MDALVLALALALSPFFFGQSFRVLDRQSLVAACRRGTGEASCVYVREPRTSRLVAFTALAAIATMMRQVAVWLFLPATVGVLTSGLPARKAGARRVDPGARRAAASRAAGRLGRSAASRDRTARALCGITRCSICCSASRCWDSMACFSCLWTSSGRSRGGLGTEAASSLERPWAIALVGLAAGALSSAVGKDPYVLGWLSFAGRLYPGPRHTSILLWAFAPVGAATAAIIGCTRLAYAGRQSVRLVFGGGAPDDGCRALLVPALCRLPDPSAALMPSRHGGRQARSGSTACAGSLRSWSPWPGSSPSPRCRDHRDTTRRGVFRRPSRGLAYRRGGAV